MKKTIALVLSMILVLSVCGCKSIETELSNTESSVSVDNVKDYVSASSADYSSSEETKTSSKPNNDSKQTETEKTDSKIVSSTSSTLSNGSTVTTSDDLAHIHSFSNGTCDEAAVCDCGVSSGSALGHKWLEANCINPRTCARCGITDGEKNSHNIVINECVLCGYRCQTLDVGDTWTVKDKFEITVSYAEPLDINKYDEYNRHKQLNTTTAVTIKWTIKDLAPEEKKQHIGVPTYSAKCRVYDALGNEGDYSFSQESTCESIYGDTYTKSWSVALVEKGNFVSFCMEEDGQYVVFKIPIAGHCVDTFTETGGTSRVSGEITYQYNRFSQPAGDAGARIVLMPRKTEYLSQEIYMGDIIHNKAKQYDNGIIALDCDENGRFDTGNIPAGKYVAIIVSKNASLGKFADVPYFVMNSFFGDYIKLDDCGFSFVTRICQDYITLEPGREYTISKFFGYKEYNW